MIGTSVSAATGSAAGPAMLLNKPILAGSILGLIRSFDGVSWSAVGGGFIGSSVESLVEFNSELIAGGSFYEAGGFAVEGLARFDGTAWRPFPDQRAGGAEDLIVHKGELYAGGSWYARGPNDQKTNYAITGVLRWTGQQWVNVGVNFPSDTVFTLASYQGRLYAGGFFRGPNQPGDFIASYDGTSWQSVGGGMAGTVWAMRPFDPDGPGPMPQQLIVGGSFSMAGSVLANRIAAWNGSQWSAMGAGVGGTVRALTEWKGRLVVAGQFFSAGGIDSPGLAFWSCPNAVPCYANCDASTVMPTLNVADFVCFMNRFAASDPGANCDSSTTPPALNVADFICYVNRFAAGCS
ncbi:MAG: GC-type dockerin domain-anchored protein [Phycisphaerales bacterium]